MTLRIMVSRHSAFYSPLISTIAAGFLKQQGLEASYSILGPGQRSHLLIRDGVVDVMQSAVSSNWKPMERGESPLAVHFAQINQRDGFFLVARTPEAPFHWKNLEGRTLLADHGLQPMVMLRYAADCSGVDWARIRSIDAGTPEEMTAAFRAGTGDYVHLQGPAPQQLEHDGIGHIVASVGQSMPPVAFSSLCASRTFLQTQACQSFLRAFRNAKEWVRQAPPEEVVAKETSFFPGIDPAVLAAAVRRYQTLGCWDGGIEIPRELYEQALNVFERVGEITMRPSYEEVCSSGS
jgi:NitT/TauT family transport system substrate-binding protein